LSHPQVGTYTPHSDISFEEKSASKETLEVDTFEYAAEDIDITESKQSPYDLLGQSLMSIRKGLMNGVEQKFLSEITNAEHDINSGTALEVTTVNILDILEEAEGKLGAFDAPYETAMRACVLGPRTVARLRRAKSDRESKLGDSVLANGVVGPWQGWTVVQSNNLPWSGTLELATEPTNGDTVTIAGVTFEFQDDLDNTTSGYVGVLCGTNVDTTRAALVACINDSGTAGTDYVQMDAKSNFIIRRKRRITATNDNSNDEMTLAGFGDIAVSDDLTDATDCWADQQQ